MSDQTMNALARANEIRGARAKDKKLIKFTLLDPLTILDAPPVHWQNATVMELLMSMHRVGRLRALKWLEMAGVKEDRKLGDLTPHQRHRLHAFVVWGKAALPPTTQPPPDSRRGL